MGQEPEECGLQLAWIAGEQIDPGGGRVRIDLGDRQDSVEVVFAAQDCTFEPEHVGDLVLVGNPPSFVELTATDSTARNQAVVTLLIDRSADLGDDGSFDVTIGAPPEARVVLQDQTIVLDLRARAGLEYYLALGAVIIFVLIVVMAAIRSAVRHRHRAGS